MDECNTCVGQSFQCGILGWVLLVPKVMTRWRAPERLAARRSRDPVARYRCCMLHRVLYQPGGSEVQWTVVPDEMRGADAMSVMFGAGGQIHLASILPSLSARKPGKGHEYVRESQSFWLCIIKTPKRRLCGHPT